MQTGGPSAPTSASAVSSITLTTQWLRYFKCLYKVSRTVFTPRIAASGQTRVSLEWIAIATTHLLEERRNPRKPLGMAKRELDLRICRQLCYYSFLDPPARQEKAVPIELVVTAAKGSTNTVKGRCLGDLIHIVLYFCLRSCEYTKTNSHKCTTQFQFRYLKFHDSIGILPFDSPVLLIRRTTAVTLYLNTQKNYVPWEPINMEATGIYFGCAVGAAAERFLNLRLHCMDLDTPIFTHFSSGRSEGSSVPSLHLVAILHFWAGHIGFDNLDSALIRSDPTPFGQEVP